jgi:hypothetical protein
VTYGTETNATATTTAGSVTLYRNASDKGTEEITQLAGGYYNYTAINPGNENYTGSSATWFLTVKRANDTVYLFLNSSESNLVIRYGVGSNASASSTSGAESLYRNDSSVSNPEIDVLAAGYHEYFANTSGNQNYTANSTGKTYYLTVDKITSACSLVFDKSSSQTYGAKINATCSCDSQEAGAVLWRNDTDVTSSENDTLVTLGAGDWDYACNVSSTQNYTNATNTSIFTIDKESTWLNLSASPSWSETYGAATTINCSANNTEVTEELFLNGTPVSIPHTTTLAANVYNYSCRANTTQNYTYYEINKTLTISKASTTTNLYLNGSESDLAVTYGTATNATATTSAGTVTLYRNASDKGTQEVTQLSAGYYNYTAINPGNENYTGSSATWFLTVNKANDAVYLFLNSSESNLAITYGTDSNASALSTSGTENLYRNDSSVSNPEIDALAAGYHEYFANTSGNQNYTANTTGKTYYLTISKAASTCSLVLDPGSTITYKTQINATCSCDNPEDSPVLLRNSTDVTGENDTFVTLGAGSYNYTCSIADTQNYTSAANTSILTVNRNASLINLTLNSSENNISIEYGQDVNISAALIEGDEIVQIYLESSLINSGSAPQENITTFTDIGAYNVTAVYPESQNYTSSSRTFFVFVNDTTEPVVQLVSPPNGFSTGDNNLTFVCNATNYNLSNMTLYHNISGSWQENRTETVTGTSAEENFTFTGLGDGNYSWNCKVYDVAGNNAWATANWSATVSFVNSVPNITNVWHSPSAPDTSDSVTIYVNVSDDNLGQVMNCSLGGNFSGSTTAITTGGDLTLSISVGVLSARNYSYNVTCNDTYDIDTYDPDNFTVTDAPAAQPPAGGGGGGGGGGWDLCRNVTCTDGCEGNYRTYNGLCSGGFCEYSREYCYYGCSGGACLSDQCAGVSCASRTTICWDDSLASCTPSCSRGVCGTCNPDCPSVSEGEGVTIPVTKGVGKAEEARGVGENITEVAVCGNNVCEVGEFETCRDDCIELPAIAWLNYMLSLLWLLLLLLLLIILYYLYRKWRKWRTENAFREVMIREAREKDKFTIKAEELDRFIKTCLTKGLTPDEIKAILIAKGWSEDIVHSYVHLAKMKHDIQKRAQPKSRDDGIITIVKP